MGLGAGVGVADAAGEASGLGPTLGEAVGEANGGVVAGVTPDGAADGGIVPVAELHPTRTTTARTTAPRKALSVLRTSRHRQRLRTADRRVGPSCGSPQASTRAAQQRSRCRVTSPETTCDLLTRGSLGRHDQGDPVDRRKRSQSNLELALLLLQEGDGVRLRRPVEFDEAGREPPRDRRVACPADDQIGAGPVEPAPDVVGKPTRPGLDDKTQERFLGHVRGELRIARRSQGRAVDR